MEITNKKLGEQSHITEEGNRELRWGKSLEVCKTRP